MYPVFFLMPAYDCMFVCVCMNNTEFFCLLEGIIREAVKAKCQQIFP